jgi:hypothetical protein
MLFEFIVLSGAQRSHIDAKFISQDVKRHPIV